MPSPDPKSVLLHAGAASWADTFGVVPPERQSAMERALEEAPAAVQTSVTEALYHHDYAAFRAAVQRALLSVVDGGSSAKGSDR